MSREGIVLAYHHNSGTGRAARAVARLEHEGLIGKNGIYAIAFSELLKNRFEFPPCGFFLSLGGDGVNFGNAREVSQKVDHFGFLQFGTVNVGATLTGGIRKRRERDDVFIRRILSDVRAGRVSYTNISPWQLATEHVTGYARTDLHAENPQDFYWLVESGNVAATALELMELKRAFSLKHPQRTMMKMRNVVHRAVNSVPINIICKSKGKLIEGYTAVDAAFISSFFHRWATYQVGHDGATHHLMLIAKNAADISIFELMRRLTIDYFRNRNGKEKENSVIKSIPLYGIDEVILEFDGDRLIVDSEMYRLRNTKHSVVIQKSESAGLSVCVFRS